jgi:hypothetical protein
VATPSQTICSTPSRPSRRAISAAPNMANASVQRPNPTPHGRPRSRTSPSKPSARPETRTRVTKLAFRELASGDCCVEMGMISRGRSREVLYRAKYMPSRIEMTSPFADLLCSLSWHDGGAAAPLHNGDSLRIHCPARVDA